jgi:6-phosphogluconate dehydrogenase
MTLAMIGLGRMGGTMVRRLMRGGHRAVVFDLDPHQVLRLSGEGAVGSNSLEDLVAKLPAPRIVWLMVPAGGATERVLESLVPLLAEGDIIVDGGNAYFKDDVRRASEMAPLGIDYVDVGTSGGVWGLERGYCLMVGSSLRAFSILEPIFQVLAPGRGAVRFTPGREASDSTADQGYLHCGPPGAGHFVKMIHNGIEYGLMQAYAEGFAILHNASAPRLPPEHRFEFNVADIAELWRRGSVVGSWLLDLAAIALTADPGLDGFSGRVEDSGEGRWTVLTAIEEAVPVDVLAASLFARFRSRQDHPFADRLLSALRQQFGGHVEPRRDDV